MGYFIPLPFRHFFEQIMIDEREVCSDTIAVEGRKITFADGIQIPKKDPKFNFNQLCYENK